MKDFNVKDGKALDTILKEYGREDVTKYLNENFDDSFNGDSEDYTDISDKEDMFKKETMKVWKVWIPHDTDAAHQLLGGIPKLFSTYLNARNYASETARHNNQWGVHPYVVWDLFLKRKLDYKFDLNWKNLDHHFPPTPEDWLF